MLSSFRFFLITTFLCLNAQNSTLIHNYLRKDRKSCVGNIFALATCVYIILRNSLALNFNPYATLYWLLLSKLMYGVPSVHSIHIFYT